MTDAIAATRKDLQQTISKSISLPGLASISWIRHGFTTRAMGDLGVFPQKFAREGLPARLKNVLRDLGMDDSKAALAQQVHETQVCPVWLDDPAPSLRERTDALICNSPGIPLVTFGADCPNVFLVDLAKKAIGLAHSGRLGTLARIVPKTIAAMHREFGTQSKDLIAAISPSIGPCCYPTDLWGMLRSQLMETGVAEIFHERVCTCCNADKFYSYRKSKNSCGRMMGALMITIA